MRARLVNRISVIALATVGTIGIAAANPTNAAGITFTFDTVGSVGGLSQGASYTTIQSYMNNIIDLTYPAATYPTTGVTVMNGSYAGAAYNGYNIFGAVAERTYRRRPCGGFKGNLHEWRSTYGRHSLRQLPARVN